MINILQALEQTEAMLVNLSPVLWTYKENLKKQGFSEEQAFLLVKDFQNSLISNSKAS